MYTSATAELEALETSIEDTETRSLRVKRLKEIVDTGNSRMEEHKKVIESLARGVVQEYIECAKSGDAHNHAALFTILSIWLEHPEALPTTASNLCSLPARKLLPMASQLAARLGRTGSEVLDRGIRSVLFFAAKRYPHVVVPHLLQLAFGDAFSPSEEVVNPDQGQLSAARNILQELRQSGVSRDSLASNGCANGSATADIHVTDILDQTRHLFELYLAIAWVGVDTTKELVKKSVQSSSGSLDHLLEEAAKMKTRHKLGNGFRLYKLLQSKRRVSIAPILTQPQTTFGVEPPCIYIEGFSAPDNKGGRKPAEFLTAGGINMPNIVNCWGSDGRIYKQLVKGRDDIRQDAVMQQFFCLVNELLRRDEQARLRALRLRVYSVVPLAPTAGILQWVEGTIPLMQYLTGPNGAHERYRPADMKHKEARTIMERVRTNKNPNRLKVEDEYSRVCKNLKPVMHHFFHERWSAAVDWYDRRLLYSRSLGTSSMVGFVVGLGDRHSSNILIDTLSAELVHIDLGIAFDQGTLLRTPECVPFRLTRDLEDALGVTGVDGPMRGAAEQTMRGLRKHSEALLSTLQVVVHNPLYRWSLDHKRMQSGAGAQGTRLGPQRVGVVNLEAERALMRVQLKLEGRVHGCSECLGIEGQVQHLIVQARDPERLSRMFEGWASWL